MRCRLAHARMVRCPRRALGTHSDRRGRDPRRTGFLE
jgi:hypothetical protein